MQEFIHLLNGYKSENSIKYIEKHKRFQLDPEDKFISMAFEDWYVNTPSTE
jgi:hypothetical protein